MKKALITLFLLILIFIFLNSGLLNIIKTSAFHYTALGILILVIAAAGLIIGFKPQTNDSNTALHKENIDEN